VHKSGRVLGKDLLHTEIFVRMAPAVRQPSRMNGDTDRVAGVLLPDPYVMAGSPVQLNGAFRTLKEVEVGRTSRRAHYKLNGNSRYGSDFDHLIPNVILVDAFWRFGTVRANEHGALSVYVPERCDSMKVFFDYADFDAEPLRCAVTFHGTNPRAECDVLHVGPIDAFDATGRMLLRVEGGVCRKFGDIEVP
jgi:polyketide synthase-like dehydratase family protein